MHFDLTSLKLFVQVTESKSITKGAEKMHLSLPAVSNRIKELESQAGVRLLYRAPKGVAVTPAGQVLLQHALTLLSQVENLKDDMQRFCEGVKGHIRVFANTTAVTEFMPEVLASFRLSP
ncbi:MAG: LysR family transcriptional regulator [Candidatus Dechloromonas phosphoritropha]